MQNIRNFFQCCRSKLHLTLHLCLFGGGVRAFCVCVVGMCSKLLFVCWWGKGDDHVECFFFGTLQNVLRSLHCLSRRRGKTEGPLVGGAGALLSARGPSTGSVLDSTVVHIAAIGRSPPRRHMSKRTYSCMYSSTPTGSRMHALTDWQRSFPVFGASYFVDFIEGAPKHEGMPAATSEAAVHGLPWTKNPGTTRGVVRLVSSAIQKKAPSLTPLSMCCRQKICDENTICMYEGLCLGAISRANAYCILFPTPHPWCTIPVRLLQHKQR